MTIEQANQLINIYNALLQINTKGEDTIIMAECLISLKTLLPQLKVDKEVEHNG